MSGVNGRERVSLTEAQRAQRVLLNQLALVKELKSLSIGKRINGKKRFHLN